MGTIRLQSDNYVQSLHSIIHKVIHTVHIAESPLFFWSHAYLGSHFAPAFYFLSPERRHALRILYAIFRILDDAVDKGDNDPRSLLGAWRTLFESKNPSCLSQYGQEIIARELVLVMKTFDIPSFVLTDFIDQGVMVDLKQKRFGTAMDTEGYCYGVAGTVGLACLPIFGVPWQEAKDFAVRLGITVQWINTIRDVGVDAKMNRIYLPLDHLEKFGCTENELLSGKQGPNFLSLMSYEGNVAKSNYKRAMELMPQKWERELLPARIMGRIYMKLLAKIEKQEYPVLTKKITLNVFEKGIATWNAVRHRYDNHVLEKSSNSSLSL